LPVSVAILDPAGEILGVNEAWRDFGRQNGLHVANSGVGANYLQYCKSPDALRLRQDLKDLLAGKRDLLTRIYPCDSAIEKHWFFLIGLPLSLQQASGAALLHVGLTPFLRAPITTRSKPSGKSSQEHVVRDIDLDWVAKSVENSSLEALSSQLTTMLTVGRQAPSSCAPKDDVERILADACLTKRQLQILGLLAEGKTNTEIAKALFRSPHTIKLHVSKIFQQLNVKSRTQAALIASKLAKSDVRSNGA
jgi:DNA-binding CsgD family transcriptional regulator